MAYNWVLMSVIYNFTISFKPLCNTCGTQWIKNWGLICYFVNVVIHNMVPLLNISGQSELWKWISSAILCSFSLFETKSLTVPVLCLWGLYLLLHSCCHRLPLSFFLFLGLCFHPAKWTPPLPAQPPYLCVQGSSEACSWLRPSLLWAKDTAGGQGSGSSLKKSRQIKNKKYWGRKK